MDDFPGNNLSSPIYTIGYGGRSIDEFLATLHAYGIKYLLDVRSSPFSRFRTEYSRDALRSRLKEAGMTYVFFGDTLGGRPPDPECYVNGLVDYDICRTKPFFQEGINRLQMAWSKQLPLVVMCSEGRPEDCHRSKMIGVALEKQGIPLKHIDESGNLKSQYEVMTSVTKHQGDLFLPSPSAGLTSRKRYQADADDDT
jgi:uncharacterized protein (DUF488 family)